MFPTFKDPLLPNFTSSPPNAFFVAVDEASEEVLGGLGLASERDQHGNESLAIVKLFVVPNKKRMGGCLPHL